MTTPRDEPQPGSTAPTATVPRTTTLARIDRASTVVTICAPTGHGKRTLVAQWVDRCTRRGALVTVLRCDADEEQGLWRGILDAVGRPDEHERAAAVHALFAIETPVVVATIRAAASAGRMQTELERLARDVPHLRVFALVEDLHAADAATSAASRALVLDGGGLALDRDECLALLRRRWPTATADDADAAREQLGGVPHLLAAWLAHAGGRRPSGADRLLASIDEAMRALVGRLPLREPVLAGVARISLAPSMRVDLGRAVVEAFDETAAWLLAHGLTTPSHEARPTLVLHPAVRRALVDATRSLDAAAASPHDAVASAMQVGEPAIALDLAVEQGRWAVAAAIAHQHVDGLMVHRTSRTLASLLAIPASWIVEPRRFATLVELCGGPRAIDDPTPPPFRPPVDHRALEHAEEPVRLLFEGAFALFAITERGELRTARALHGTLASFATAHGGGVQAAARRAPVLRTVGALASLARAEASSAVALLRPHPDEPELPSVHLRPVSEALELRIRAAAHAMDGRGRRARRLLERARRLPIDESIAELHGGLERVATGFLALDAATPQDLQELPGVDGTRQPLFIRHGLLYLRARIRAWADHDEALDADLEAAVARDATADGVLESPILAAAIAERAWQRGLDVEERSPSGEASLAWLASQRALLARGAFAEVVARAPLADDPGAPPSIRVESALLAAHASRCLGDDAAAEARETVAASIAAAVGMRGARRLVIPEASTSRRTPAPCAAEATEAQRWRAAAPAIDWSLLSRAEWEVLSELSSGASLEEVAALRFVSRNTVKTQVAAIYRKLGVRSRAEAVRALRTRASARRGQRPS